MNRGGAMASTERDAVRPSTAGKTALTNVRVFDGRQLLPPGTVMIEAGRIVADSAGTRIVDCAGGVMLPGLIDAHVHLSGPQTLDQLDRKSTRLNYSHANIS